MPDAVGSAFNVGPLDGYCRLPQVFDNLLVKPDHQPYRACAPNRGLSVRILNTH
jgi:hypothetical protein